MKLIIDEIGRQEIPDDISTYDDMEPTPWTPDEGEEVRLRMEERKRGWDAGEWNAIGVRACAKLHWTDDDSQTSITGPTISTPGIWGVESDAGEEYFEEIYREELHVLGEMLKAMGLSEEDINAHL